jgi:hypothetical protein
LPSLSVVVKYSSGSYPSVALGFTGQWSLNAGAHALEWSIPLIAAAPSADGTAGETSGSMEFTVGGEDADAFFPVKISFVGLGSLLGLEVSESFSYPMNAIKL